MNAQTESFEEEYEEYDEFDEDDEDGERGLSGLVVLLMGIVMLGAFASVVWIAYQQGIKAADANGRSGAPYVAADPEPVKIENKTADAASKGDERAVYDRFDGQESAPVETLAQGPEEPVTRSVSDPIAAIASKGEDKAGVIDDAAGDRIAKLAAADQEALGEQPAPSKKPDASTTRPATAPTPAAVQTQTPVVPAPTGGALSGSHLVQIGAFGSQTEADQSWARLQKKLGEYLSAKSPDVERADLGAKGVYYRLRVGPFASYDDAMDYCQGLKSRGQDCLVKAK